MAAIHRIRPTSRASTSRCCRSQRIRGRLAEAIHRCIALGKVNPLREMLLQRVLPADDDLVSDAALEAYLGRTVMTGQHISSTCRMARSDDPMGVVDVQGRVRGVAGLRVVDGSIMPDSVRANIHATVLAMTWLLAGRIAAGTAAA